MGNAAIANASLYINGIKIPVQSLTVTNQVGMPPFASVDVFPSGLLAKLRSRTHIAIFAKGDWSDTEVLIFEGELSRPGFMVNATNVSMNLQCLGYLNHLNFLKMMYYTGLVTPLAKYLAAATNIMSIIAPLTMNADTGAMRLLDFTEGGKSPLDTMMSKINTVYQLNDFWKAMYTDFISGRYHMAENSMSAAIDKVSKRAWAQETMQTLPLYGTMLQYLRTIADLHSYDIVSNTNVYDKSILVKPAFFWPTPPVCNILFPDQVTNVPLHGNNLATPTRLINVYEPNLTGSDKQMTGGPGLLSGISPFSQVLLIYLDSTGNARPKFYADKFLEEFRKDMTGKGIQTTAEEAAKGIIMENTFTNTLLESFIAAAIAGESAVQQSDRKTAKEQVLEYQFWKIRYNSETTIVGYFNPYPIPGFPLLLGVATPQVDKDHLISTMGYLAATSSTLTPNGGRTEYKIMHYFDPANDIRPKLSWVDSTEFADTNISTYYQQWLGCPSLHEKSKQGGATGKDIPEALVDLLQQYKNSNDKLKFRSQYSRRTMLTPDLYFTGALQATLNGEDYESSKFRGPEKDILLDYRKEARKGAAVR